MATNLAIDSQVLEKAIPSRSCLERLKYVASGQKIGNVLLGFS